MVNHSEELKVEEVDAENFNDEYQFENRSSMEFKSLKDQLAQAIENVKLKYK